MNEAYLEFDKLRKQDRRDVFEAAAARLGATVQSIEKDLWVCRVIDALFKGLPRQPKPFFKGGTSLSKGYGLIKRFSEDIDIVLSPKGLGIRGDADPLAAGLSKKKREKAAEATKEVCSAHVLGKMKEQLGGVLPTCNIIADDTDANRMSLKVVYPSMFEQDDYLKPWVKIECGARGAVEPDIKRTIRPYIQDELGAQLDLSTDKVTLIKAERTFWEKALILHGIYCGHRDDADRRPGDNNLISRHYYDVAMMADSKEAGKALRDHGLLDKVREHKLALFRRGWEKLNEAVPGSVRLVPQATIQDDLKRDYEAMQGMMFGDAPEFDWIIDQLAGLEAAINAK
ncbi:MAG: nucleotidyl transferase AbiEii/AbiGii toxin family protein [Alphaproteobacteria bacterium]|nr:nucleotidyl transferase AbiEii/AbiGii toxin family protein [Alphaproteobacteria bacterium]